MGKVVQFSLPLTIVLFATFALLKPHFFLSLALSPVIYAFAQAERNFLDEIYGNVGALINFYNNPQNSHSPAQIMRTKYVCVCFHRVSNL